MIGFWQTKSNTHLYFIYKIYGDLCDMFQIYVPTQKHPKLFIMNHSYLSFMEDALESGELKKVDGKAFNKISETNKKKCIREVFS